MYPQNSTVRSARLRNNDWTKVIFMAKVGPCLVQPIILLLAGLFLCRSWISQNVLLKMDVNLQQEITILISNGKWLLEKATCYIPFGF